MSDNKSNSKFGNDYFGPHIPENGVKPYLEVFTEALNPIASGGPASAQNYLRNSTSLIDGGSELESGLRATVGPVRMRIPNEDDGASIALSRGMAELGLSAGGDDGVGASLQIATPGNTRVGLKGGVNHLEVIPQFFDAFFGALHGFIDDAYRSGHSPLRFDASTNGPRGSDKSRKRKEKDAANKDDISLVPSASQDWTDPAADPLDLGLTGAPGQNTTQGYDLYYGHDPRRPRHRPQTGRRTPNSAGLTLLQTHARHI